MTRPTANERAVEWLARHDPEYDWRADAARRHGNGDYIGAVIDNLRDFGTDEDEAGSVAEAIAIIGHAHRGIYAHALHAAADAAEESWHAASDQGRGSPRR